MFTFDQEKKNFCSGSDQGSTKRFNSGLTGCYVSWRSPDQPCLVCWIESPCLGDVPWILGSRHKSSHKHVFSSFGIICDFKLEYFSILSKVSFREDVFCCLIFLRLLIFNASFLLSNLSFLMKISSFLKYVLN